MEDVRRVAAEWVARHGQGAVRRLREPADEAAALGDFLSAEAWSGIARLAEEIVAKGVWTG